MIDTIAPSAVIVGERHRRDLGDLGALARDIDEIGLLQPIVITPDYRLIAGARRLAAWQMSKHRDEPLPAHVVDIPSLVRGEFSENMLREDFTLSERLAIMDALERELGSQRDARPTEKRPAPGRPSSLEFKVLMDVVGDHLGMGRETLRKAAAVRDAARRNPGRYQTLFDEMDRTGKVDRVFQRLRVLDGLSPTQTRAAGHVSDLLDALLTLPLSTAKQRLREYEQAASFLSTLIAAAAIPDSESVAISTLVTEECIAEARNAAMSVEIRVGAKAPTRK